jgi:hypothetical protein
MQVDGTAAWGIHAGGRRSPFLQPGVVVLERAGIGDLREIGPDRGAIKAELARSYPDAKSGTIAAWAGVLLRFAFEPGSVTCSRTPSARQTRSASDASSLTTSGRNLTATAGDWPGWHAAFPASASPVAHVTSSVRASPSSA